MYFLREIPIFPKELHKLLVTKWSPLRKMVTAAFMAVIAAILQSAGGFLPGIGLIISPFATLPILIGTILSLRYGIFAYGLTILLLILLEPSELFIYPFTTGLLGLSLGWTFCVLHKRLGIFVANGFVLTIGICIPLYLLNFPVFGPGAAASFTISGMLLIFSFSVVYSWIWAELGLYLLKKIMSGKVL